MPRTACARVGSTLAVWLLRFIAVHLCYVSHLLDYPLLHLDQTAPVITVKRLNDDGEGLLQKLNNGNYLYTVPHASTYVALVGTAEDEVDAADPAVSTSGGSLAFVNTGALDLMLSSDWTCQPSPSERKYRTLVLQVDFLFFFRM